MTLQEVLADHGVSADDIEKGMAYQAKAGGALEKILLNMGSFSEELLPSIYSDYLKAPILSIEERDSWSPPETPSDFPDNFFLSNGWLLASSEQTLGYTFFSKSPLCRETLQFLLNERLRYRVIIISDSDFDILQTRLVPLGQSNAEAKPMLSDMEEDRLRELASEAPTVNLLNSLISRALRMRASDMHIEPVSHRYRVRFRIDGVLHDIDFLPDRLQLPIISRLKILSGMDIAEKRRPQDGKIEMRVANTSLDIRVSSLPVNRGESVVMRFLRKDSLNYDLKSLDLSSDISKSIIQDLRSTSGVILMTGPTGSGKTTTLYTFLNQLNSEYVKIVSLEDPVEYQLPGLNQVNVRPEIGFDFSAGLRSIVRQDPDIIMVGEIRDKETCQIALQAALTGHLVFSTVHTNDAPSAFTRLLDLGVEEFLLNAALLSVMAQRLARKLCPHCTAPADKEEEILSEFGLRTLAQRFDIKEISLKKAVGCEECDFTGFKGRIAIIEYLSCDKEVRAMPKDDQFLARAKSYNRDCGRRDLIEDGLLKALEGKTTVEEVFRVCG